MKAPEPLVALESSGPQDVALENVSFAYDGGAPIFRGLTLTAYPGDIIGVTGPVACGKSTLGRVFLCKQCYGGSIRIGGRELSGLTPREIAAVVGYLGHDPELWNDTVAANVLCGRDGDAMTYLTMTALDGEVWAMEQGLDTVVGRRSVWR